LNGGVSSVVMACPYKHNTVNTLMRDLSDMLLLVRSIEQETATRVRASQDLCDLTQERNRESRTIVEGMRVEIDAQNGFLLGLRQR